MDVVKTSEKPAEPEKPEEPKEPLPPSEPEEDEVQTPEDSDNGDDGEVTVDTEPPEDSESEDDIQVTDDEGNVVKENSDEEDYLHGRCHEWALNHYERGDRFFVIMEYDEELESNALLHCGLFRHGMFLDAEVQSDNIDDILENFDYGEDYDVQILTKDEFMDFCQDFGLL